MNKVCLVGRLTKDIAVRTTASGTNVGSFTLAVNREFKTNDGITAEYINCVAWNKVCDIISNYTSKGSQIGIAGRLQTRSYTHQKYEDVKVYVTEVIVESITLLDSKSKEVETNKEPKLSAITFDITESDIQF